MVSKKGIVVALLLASIGLIGCTNKIILYPIQQSDIQSMKAGEAYTPEKDGYFISDYYLEEVAKARVGK